MEEAELEMERKRKAFQGRPLFSPFPTAATTRAMPSEFKGKRREVGCLPCQES